MEYWSGGGDRMIYHYSNTPSLQYSKFSSGGFTMAMPSVGSKAPDFILPVSREQNISLKDYQGKQNVVLACYPLDFTGG